jgi:hypothetical protein
VTVVTGEGDVATNARLGAWACDVALGRGRVEVVTPGTFRVRGLPFLPGEPVTLLCAEAGGDGDFSVFATTVTPRLAGSWRETLRLSRAWDSTVGVSGTQVDPAAALAPWVPPPAPPPAPPRTGTVRARVVDAEGAPLPEARVNGVPVGESGFAVLAAVPEGRHRVSGVVAGRLPATAVVVVRPDETTEVVLVEPAGATLDVVVVDEAGEPRPSARLSLEVGWFDVRDGVQRLDLFTDRLGRRTLTRVEPGPVTVGATWGSRTGSAGVTLRDGGRATVRVVAK